MRITRSGPAANNASGGAGRMFAPPVNDPNEGITSTSGRCQNTGTRKRRRTRAMLNTGWMCPAIT
jgi:hypothetical protein